MQRGMNVWGDQHDLKRVLPQCASGQYGLTGVHTDELTNADAVLWILHMQIQHKAQWAFGVLKPRTQNQSHTAAAPGRACCVGTIAVQERERCHIGCDRAIAVLNHRQTTGCQALINGFTVALQYSDILSGVPFRKHGFPAHVR
ncbi:hypothetical protein DNK77_28825 [Enterobacter cloacae complex sp.]|nr:hypothetical protein [Citrobacter koseri]MBE0080359.1 hypothetical protein [Citrobacter koseri]PYZ20460.1 hypothetical protein DNK77_28825 [Enterobacter cloacae complex sp.]RAY67520.1 hypothetical protein DP199_20230 [Enterobacter kobei]